MPQASFKIHQLVLSQTSPHWGYGRITEIKETDLGPQYWTYFYHIDQFVSLSLKEIKEVPANYQPPFAPDPDVFFGEKKK